jgi:hypothetical protein
MKSLPVESSRRLRGPPVDGGTLQPVMLHEVARRLKIDEASAEAAMYRAVAERWLIVEGSSLYRIRLTATGQALLPPR